MYNAKRQNINIISLTKPPVKSAAHLRKLPRARFLTTGGTCTTAADIELHDTTNIPIEILLKNAIVVIEN